MAACSHRYHHGGYCRFETVGWIPRWCKCGNRSIMRWLPRLQNLSNCIPHSCHTYMWCLSTFNCCGLAFGCALHGYHHRHFPSLGEMVEIVVDVSVQTIPLCYGWSCRTFQTVSHIHVTCIWGIWTLSLLWTGIKMHTHTLTTTDISQIWGSWLKSYVV